MQILKTQNAFQQIKSKPQNAKLIFPLLWGPHGSKILGTALFILLTLFQVEVMLNVHRLTPWLLLTLIILVEKPTKVAADFKEFPKRLTWPEKIVIIAIFVLAFILIILVITFIIKQCICSRKSTDPPGPVVTNHPEAPPETSVSGGGAGGGESPNHPLPPNPVTEPPSNRPATPRLPQSAEPAVPPPSIDVSKSTSQVQQPPDPDEDLKSAKGSEASRSKSKKSRKSKKSHKSQKLKHTKSVEKEVEKEVEKPALALLEKQLVLESCKDAPSLEVTLRHGLPSGMEATKDGTLDDEELKTTREDEITGMPTQKLALPKCTLYKVQPQIEDAWSVLEYIKNNRIAVKPLKESDSDCDEIRNFEHPDCKKMVETLQKTYESKNPNPTQPEEIAPHHMSVLVCVNKLGKLSKQAEYEATKRQTKISKDNEFIISPETRAWLQEPQTTTLQRHAVYALELKSLFTFNSSATEMKEKLSGYPVSILYFYVLRNDVPLWIRIQALELLRIKALPFLYAPIAIINALPHPFHAIMMAATENPQVVNDEKWFLFNESAAGSADQARKPRSREKIVGSKSKTKSVTQDPAPDNKDKKSKDGSMKEKKKRTLDKSR
uniref:Death domain-containing protein n=1 Tax=Panagrellus redivivus TaxID=6233 RepID=A0A7E4VHT8_PANRE